MLRRNQTNEDVQSSENEAKEVLIHILNHTLNQIINNIDPEKNEKRTKLFQMAMRSYEQTPDTFFITLTTLLKKEKFLHLFLSGSQQIVTMFQQQTEGEANYFLDMQLPSVIQILEILWSNLLSSVRDGRQNTRKINEKLTNAGRAWYQSFHKDFVSNFIFFHTTEGLKLTDRQEILSQAIAPLVAESLIDTMQQCIALIQSLNNDPNHLNQELQSIYDAVEADVIETQNQQEQLLLTQEEEIQHAFELFSDAIYDNLPPAEETTSSNHSDLSQIIPQMFSIELSDQEKQSFIGKINQINNSETREHLLSLVGSNSESSLTQYPARYQQPRAHTEGSDNSAKLGI